ncbi:Maf family protein [Streptococcus parasuis]|uniref:Maf family protein n=1 Tax=Streptococcus parasuis TaxID=1501662 RepID=UPI001C2BF291|nr:Maf family protein [Streptococcus parasuis]MBV1944107.1 Maf family protein [Streptococcus parasuis]QXF06337.1 Maf family protein [Streptococcus parasuis]WJQ85829.1 Maf family protein [Streptococcus parasuis]
MQTVFQYQREGKREPISSYVVLSNSPRRKELLKFLKPHITSVEVDERGIEEYFMNQFASDDFLTRAAKTCCEISKAKSEIKLAPEHLYISADTIVIADEQIFNKPKDLTEAEEMFRSYFGKSHYVVTSVCLRTSQSLDVFYTLAQIDFVDYYPALEELIQSYIFEKRPLDKAGAYGIQELDPRFVASIYGDVHTIIGLPVAEVSLRIFDDSDFEK